MRSVFSLLLVAILIIVICAYGIAMEVVDYVPDEIIVKFKPGANRMSINNFNAAIGVSEITTNKELGYKVLKTPPKKNVPEMVALYNQNPNVEWAEPNYIYHLLVTPNDTYYNFQWFYFKDLLLSQSGWDVEKGSPDVIIAIVDSGVYKDHPDLDSKIWQNSDETPNNGKDDDGNGYIDDVWGWDFVGNDKDPYDEHHPPPPQVGAHGTMVAGIASAETNNSQGIAGASWYCKIMAVRVADASGNATADAVANGINYAANNGAHVINLSLGDKNPSTPIALAIDYAHDIKKCVVVAAAGNHNDHPIFYPARYPKTIAVGASDRGTADPNDPFEDDGRADFSSWGTGIEDDRLVDVVAPGVGIYSTSVKSLTGADYMPGSGTSYSAAIVSGLAALVISHTGITNDPEKIRDYINSKAKNLPDDPDDSPDAGPNWDGKGLVQFVFDNPSLVDITQHVKINQLNPRFDRNTGQTSMNISITNKSDKTILTPMQMIIYNISEKTVFVVNFDGKTDNGDAYFNFEDADGKILPKETSQLRQVIFSNPNRSKFTFDVKVMGMLEPGKGAPSIRTVQPYKITIVVPVENRLAQNYPNPFNAETWIPYELSEAESVKIRIYSIKGELVRTIDLGHKQFGSYFSRDKAAYWDGKNAIGENVSSGVYFYQIQAGEFKAKRKMVIIK